MVGGGGDSSYASGFSGAITLTVLHMLELLLQLQTLAFSRSVLLLEP